MERNMYFHRNVLPFVAMVTMESANVGLNTLSKAAMRDGMSHWVFVVYAYGVAAIILLPSPFVAHRLRVLPPMNVRIALKILLLGIIGCTSQVMGYTGINYASPTLASAISNLVPAFTFIFAIIFRMENLEFRRPSSKAKVIGTIISILGAFVATLYKGEAIVLNPSLSMKHHHSLGSSTSNWIVGGIFLTIEYILVPMWYIVLAQIMRDYPTELTVVFFYNLIVCILATFIALIAEPKPNAWKIRFDIALASVLCSGLFGSCLNNTVHTWVLCVRDPVYVAIFKPLSIAIAVAMGVIFLGDTLFLGSVLGAILISIGFYTALWGKSNEEIDKDSQTNDSESPSSEAVPLLGSHEDQRDPIL